MARMEAVLFTGLWRVALLTARVSGVGKTTWNGLWVVGG